MAERRRAQPKRRKALARATQPAQDRQQQLARWTQRIQRARKLRTDWAAKYKVDALAQTYTGDLASVSGLDEADTAIVINRFWPTIKAQMPGLLYQAPKFFVTPTGRRGGDIAYQMAAAGGETLSAIARQDEHLIQEAKLALQQSFWAIGVLKCVYDPRMERNPQAGQPMWVLGRDGEPMTINGERVPLMDETTGQQMKEPRRVLDDEVYRWQWVNWGNLLLPDEGPAMLHWSWVGEEIEVRLEDAQEDDRFPKALRDQLRPSRKPRSEQASVELPSAFDVHELDQTLWYVECWDILTKRHLIVAEGQAFSATQFLLDEDMPSGIEDHPYSILPGYTPITDPEPSPWPVPHCWNWLGLQQEYNQRREQMMNAARRSARKVYYDQSTFPDADEATAALQSDRDMEAVLVNDVNKPPVAIPDPGSPPDIARDLALLEKDWLNATGTPGERMGNPNSETATQALLSDRSATMREGEMKEAVTLWLTISGRKMLQLLKGTMTLETFVKIRDMSDADVARWVQQRFGQEAGLLEQVPGMKQQIIQRYGKERWMAVTRDDLQFEADVGVVPGSVQTRTPEQRAQQALLFQKSLAEVGAVLPDLLTSREYIEEMAKLFGMQNDRMVDEIITAVQKGIVRQQQALAAKAGGGAAPNGQQPSPAQVQGQPMIASRLQTAMMNGGF